MKIIKILPAILAAAFMLLLLVPSAKAGISTQLTEMTFSQSIRIPGGKVLPAGTYWLMIPDNGHTHRLVAIYNQNRNHLEALLQTDPALRMNATNKTVVTVAEQGKNRPDVLVNWFYPGLNYGHSFIYSLRMQRRLSEDQMMKLSANTRPMTE